MDKKSEKTVVIRALVDDDMSGYGATDATVVIPIGKLIEQLEKCDRIMNTLEAAAAEFGDDIDMLTAEFLVRELAFVSDETMVEIEDELEWRNATSGNTMQGGPIAFTESPIATMDGDPPYASFAIKSDGWLRMRVVTDWDAPFDAQPIAYLSDLRPFLKVLRREVE